MFDFDLADRVDDLICSFDNGNPDSDMDTISILLTGWITFLFCSVLLVKYIYRKYKSRAHPEPGPELEKTQEKASSHPTLPVVNGTSEIQQLSFSVPPKKGPESDAACKKSAERRVGPVPVLRCSGPSPDVVEFVTASHNWLYVDEKRKAEISVRVNSLFLKSVNKIFHGIPHEVSQEKVLSSSHAIFHAYPFPHKVP